MIKLSQLAYIDKVFNKFYFDKVNTVNSLIKKTTLLQPRAKSKGKATAAEKKGI